MPTYQYHPPVQLRTVIDIFSSRPEPICARRPPGSGRPAAVRGGSFVALRAGDRSPEWCDGNRPMGSAVGTAMGPHSGDDRDLRHRSGKRVSWRPAGAALETHLDLEPVRAGRYDVAEVLAGAGGSVMTGMLADRPGARSTISPVPAIQPL